MMGEKRTYENGLCIKSAAETSEFHLKTLHEEVVEVKDMQLQIGRV